ncbi:unnamed protein product [Allacma fusca]|uniref:Uncharacterized protein n=1 Tax=Allacma fusca TaxID=39272 RepID=A0A8J2P6Q1_9HEXA|nr:unnamed protein product [Allacma fusca]
MWTVCKESWRGLKVWRKIKLRHHLTSQHELSSREIKKEEATVLMDLCDQKTHLLSLHLLLLCQVRGQDPLNYLLQITSPKLPPKQSSFHSAFLSFSPPLDTENPEEPTASEITSFRGHPAHHGFVSSQNSRRLENGLRPKLMIGKVVGSGGIVATELDELRPSGGHRSHSPGSGLGKGQREKSYEICQRQ